MGKGRGHACRSRVAAGQGGCKQGRLMRGSADHRCRGDRGGLRAGGCGLACVVPAGEAGPPVEGRALGPGLGADGERTGPAGGLMRRDELRELAGTSLPRHPPDAGALELPGGRHRAGPHPPPRCRTSLPSASSTWTGRCSASTSKAPSTGSLCWRRQESSPQSVARVSGEPGSWGWTSGLLRADPGVHLPCHLLGSGCCCPLCGPET